MDCWGWGLLVVWVSVWLGVQRWEKASLEWNCINLEWRLWVTPPPREPPPPPPQSGSPLRYQVPKNCSLDYTLGRPLLGHAAEITGGGGLSLPQQEVYTLSIKNKSDFSFTFWDPRNIGLVFFLKRTTSTSERLQKHSLFRGSGIQECHTEWKYKSSTFWYFGRFSLSLNPLRKCLVVTQKCFSVKTCCRVPFSFYVY